MVDVRKRLTFPSLFVSLLLFYHSVGVYPALMDYGQYGQSISRFASSPIRLCANHRSTVEHASNPEKKSEFANDKII